MKILELIDKLFQELNSSSIRYCHWKSNAFLKGFLVGKGDLDLLVDRNDADLMKSLLSSLAFKKVNSETAIDYNPISHFFGLDKQSGKLVHVHLYYEIITGGNLLKTYKLPLEQMLLSNTREVHRVKLPSKAAELVIFVLRMTLKHELVAETIMIRRQYSELKEELNWLIQDQPQQEAIILLKTFLPSVDQKLFEDCFEALKAGFNPLRSGILSWRLQKTLSQYLRYSLISRLFITHCIFTKKVFERCIKKGRTKVMPGGGCIIAFVGPEATGKSTLAGETYKWLAEHFATTIVHVGKPPSTWCTFIPNKIIPLLRKVFPNHRTSRTEAAIKKIGSKKLKPTHLFVYILRAVMVAWDRLQLLRKVSRLAKKGKIVICDRYPTDQIGAMDSPRFDPSAFENKRFSLFYRLAILENRMYHKIPEPDIVIQLIVPVNIAVKRNVQRIKKVKENEDYIRRRHQVGEQMTYSKMKTIKIDTSQSLEETVLCVKKVLWEELQ